MQTDPLEEIKKEAYDEGYEEGYEGGVEDGRNEAETDRTAADANRIAREGLLDSTLGRYRRPWKVDDYGDGSWVVRAVNGDPVFSYDPKAPSNGDCITTLTLPRVRAMVDLINRGAEL